MFVVCGEALFDVFATGETPSGLAMDARIGGSPFNVAVGLARLGQPVAFLSQVSRGFLGERLMRALAAEGVDTRTVQRSDAPTTLSLIGVDGRGVPAYSFYGEGCADRLLDAAALDTLPPGVKAIHFGSYATVVGRTAETQRLLVERAQGRALVAYDPNIRLNVEPRLEVWREHIEWMLPRTQLLKVSDEDLGLVWPGLAPDEFAARALGRGVKLVVVTRGGEGALGWTASAHVAAAPVKVSVVDTVGAGDTFQAALLTWLAEHDALGDSALPTDALAEALAFAARAAAITCSRRGADMPRRAEV
ncbi:carbohydrate kinase [Piscinibacter sp.]|uniref:carbohydrate kinase family protein n=1 Tax=Piscinibacter sp. TaxID=1903157 RepID=UPI0035B07542